MRRNFLRMAYFEFIIFLCSMVIFMVVNCDAESENSSKKASLPKFLSQSNVEASIETEESLRKLVKRLAPEKNVFFGNADLLKEWLKGAGVTGQPGVDFPALTTIPATSFSCRGLKGGYYADLETNCQVFHICDNGRKISFLCPNGTIFQQSQLICDWWFKVDCSKSTELYEQSSEQLFEEEKKRTESRKSKVNYQQSIVSGQQDYYDVQSFNYDGKQNGRIKPYEESPQENQLQLNRDRSKYSRHFDSDDSSDKGSNTQREGNQLLNANRFEPSQPDNVRQQFNQFTRNTQEGNVNRYSTVSQEYYSTPKKAQNYHVTNRNSNVQRDEKSALKRLKFKESARNNFTSSTSQKVTPSYTESTTFRASNANSLKESQQLAESAAFVGNRANRFNENAGDIHQYYYQLYTNRDSTTTNPNYESTTPTTWRQNNDNDAPTQRNDFFSFDDGTSTPYETTTQYVGTTATPSCNEDATTESPIFTNPSTNFGTYPTIESLQFANSNYEYRENARNNGNVRNGFVNNNYYNNNNHKNDDGDINRANNMNANLETTFPPTRSYVTTNIYRQTTVAPIIEQQKNGTNYFSPASIASFRSNFGSVTDRATTRTTVDNQSNRLQIDSKSNSKHYSTLSPGYRQNFISTTTEKPFRTTSIYQQNTVTEKDLSPYDRSFTYKQGKVMSTLGPYVPFTRNYAYSTTSTTTAKPPPYTATVPTYITASYASPKTLLPKLKYPSPTSASKFKSNVARFREREHALSMLHSLKKLENDVPSLSEKLKENNKGYNVSAAPAPSTLHSLALYFSTATENFDSNETTDSPIGMGSAEDVERSVLSKKNNGTVEVPTSLLTQHTISSYVELFKLNDAVETNNVTTEDRLDNTSNYGDDYNDDLEFQQSGGSLDDLRKSNSTRLRELAQVFTHALSAYLLDPDSFKKVLTEIRPTEPPGTTLESEQWTTTTPYPVTNDDNTLSIGEKDEVLDFSDDRNDIRQKLTTVYPTIFEPPSTTIQDDDYDILSTVPSTYYTTPGTSIRDTDVEYNTNLISNVVTNSYSETSIPPTESTVTIQENSTSYASDIGVFYNRNNEIDEKNAKSPVKSDQVPTEETKNQNRVGGFQNNSVIIDKYSNEKFIATTPISGNYAISPTPSSPSVLVHMVTYNWNKKSSSKKPEQQLTPPFYETYSEAVRRDNEQVSVSLNPESYSSTPIYTHNVRATISGSSKDHETSTGQLQKIAHPKSLLPEKKSAAAFLPIPRNNHTKFKSVYNRVSEYNFETTERPTTLIDDVTDSITTTLSGLNTDSFTETDSTDSVELKGQRAKSKSLTNDHWTSSPVVTHLWETSVFVDPQRINHGLESDSGTTTPMEMYGATESYEKLEYGNKSSFKEYASGSSEETFADDEELPTSVQRLSRDKDSPTTFSLLPTSFPTENVATPKSLVTTRSSVITGVTSSITSTNSLPQETVVNPLSPSEAIANKLNDTETRIAEKLFGKLNTTSTDTLMRVMKQADDDETVRQLVLLLVQHCRDPANKTMQHEKDELLNALLRLPVNEFSSESSKTVVAGINQLKLSTARSVGSGKNISATTVITEPPVTTYRSRKSRKFRTTTEYSASIVRRSENGEASDENNLSQEVEASASDNRALELLRSLYTIATKWG